MHFNNLYHRRVRIFAMVCQKILELRVVTSVRYSSLNLLNAVLRQSATEPILRYARTADWRNTNLCHLRILMVRGIECSRANKL